MSDRLEALHERSTKFRHPGRQYGATPTSGFMGYVGCPSRRKHSSIDHRATPTEAPRDGDHEPFAWVSANTRAGRVACHDPAPQLSTRSTTMTDNTIPEVALDTRWDTPAADITGLDMAFGQRAMGLMPAYAEIPREFRHGRDDYSRFQQKWFSEGVSAGDVKWRRGIDPDAAWSHLEAIQGSFEPKHEHKAAGVSWLLSKWAKKVKL